MEDPQREDRPPDETTGSRPDEGTASPQAAAERVARLLADPRRA